MSRLPFRGMDLHGAKLMAPGTGVWLNNSLEYSTFEPKGNPMDAHAGRRQLSGDCPTIIMKDGLPWAALGTPGGHTIGQTVPQMGMNLIDFGMDIQAALAAPRIGFVEPDIMQVETTIPESVRTALAARGHKIQTTRAIGDGHGVAFIYDATGKLVRLEGGTDPRGAGLAKGP